MADTGRRTTLAAVQPGHLPVVEDRWSIALGSTRMGAGWRCGDGLESGCINSDQAAGERASGFTTHRTKQYEHAVVLLATG